MQQQIRRAQSIWRVKHERAASPLDVASELVKVGAVVLWAAAPRCLLGRC